MLGALICCRACGRVLSTPLTELLAVHPLCGKDGEDALPRGVFWRSAAAGDLVCVRGDLDLEACGDRSGCCGPSGLNGPNVACACGAVVGTEVGDCWQTHYVALTGVFLRPSGESRRVLVWPAGADATLWAFTAWLHEAFGLADWYGDDLGAIARAAGGASVLVLSGSAEGRAAGVPIGSWIEQLRAAGLDVMEE